jgi:hypothetical protein
LKKHTFKIHRKEDQKIIETRKNRRMEASIKRLREDNIILKIAFDDLKKGQFYEPLNSVRSDKELEQLIYTISFDNDNYILAAIENMFYDDIMPRRQCFDFVQQGNDTAILVQRYDIHSNTLVSGEEFAIDLLNTVTRVFESILIKNEIQAWEKINFYDYDYGSRERKLWQIQSTLENLKSYDEAMKKICFQKYRLHACLCQIQSGIECRG